MSLTGSGPDDPQRVGVPIGDLLAGMLRGLRRASRPASSGSGPATASSSTPSPARRASSACNAFQGNGVTTVAGQVGRGQGIPTTRSVAPYGLFRCRDGRRPARRRHRGPCGKKLCAGFDLDPDAPGQGKQRRAGGEPAAGDRRESRGRSPATDAARPAGPAGRPRDPRGAGPHLDQVYSWDQIAAQGLLIDVEPLHPRPAAPARAARCASQRRPRGPRSSSPVARTPHLRRSASTTNAVRAWLGL